MYCDCAGQPLDIGTFVVYATKSEGPSLEFGYIEDFKQGTAAWSAPKVKIQRADATGHRKNKIRSIYYPDNPDGRKFDTVDTGKPDTVWLDTSTRDRRMLVTHPV